MVWYPILADLHLVPPGDLSFHLVVTGLPAWLIHRGYHVPAVPTWERKVRVFALWLTAAVVGRDIVSLVTVQRPREAFTAGGVPPARDHMHGEGR
jgi:NADH dehydrogenase